MDEEDCYILCSVIFGCSMCLETVRYRADSLFEGKGAIYMKEKVLISIVCGAVVLGLFVVWKTGKSVDIFETLDSSELSRISVFLSGQENTFTEQEDMDKIVHVLRSMRLDKTPPISRDGGLIIELYDKSGDVEKICLSSDHIVTDSGYYICDRDYCKALVRICE